MGWRKPYFSRINFEGEVHVRSGGLQECITLCGINDFTPRDSDTTKPVNCDLCRSIATYCQDHVRLRPKPKQRKPAA